MSLLTDLISYWKLDEASGTRADSHGTNHLADNNTVASAVGKVYGTAADFEDANSESLSCAVGGLQTGNADYTVGAWVKLESKPTEATVYTNQYPGAILRYRSSSDRFEFFFGAGVQAQATSFGSPSLGVWYFVVGWYDAAADRIRIQVNDGTVNETTETTGAAGGATVQIGARNTANFFDGLIGPVAVWGRVLTSQERTDLYNAGAGLAYSAFDGASAGLLLLTGDF